MHKTHRGQLFVMALAIGMGLGLTVAQAQLVAPGGAMGATAGGPAGTPGATRAMDPETVMRIRKMPRLNSKEWLQRTPQMFAGTSRSKAREWGVFEVTYDTAPEWIDEMVVTFTVMLMSNDRDQPFSFCRVTSRFIDVAKGSGKIASAVMLPSGLLRYGRPIGFVVEFSLNGQVVAVESTETEKFLTERWWENPSIVDSPRTVKREGYLLERSKTPFGLVNIDENEVSR